MTMTAKLANAINRHRNDRKFHDVVRTMQGWMNGGLIDLRGLQDAVLLVEYDKELRKRGVGS
jgi:hypothetical protein